MKRLGDLRGFTISETMIALTIMAIVLGSVYSSSTALLGSMKASENYPVGQLAALDYLTLDLRRCQGYSFTTPTGTTTLTLPLTLQIPQYYAADGKTPNAPVRTLVTSGNFKKKKDHKVFSARYYTYYGALGTTVQVQYYLLNGTLYRKEGSLPARPIGNNIASVTFGPSAAAITADPVVTTTVTFSPSLRSKTAAPTLASTTFMRQFYYSDY